MQRVSLMRMDGSDENVTPLWIAFKSAVEDMVSEQLIEAHKYQLVLDFLMVINIPGIREHNPTEWNRPLVDHLYRKLFYEIFP